MEVKTNRTDEIGDLLVSGAKMVKNLNDIVSKVTESALATSTSITQISVSIDEQMAVSTEQSSSVAEIQTTMEELSGSSAQIAQYSTEMLESATSTLEMARDGAESVDTMSVRMKEITDENKKNIERILDLGRKSEEITKIMDIINNLADQTKLIAFNAALEAASAGEYGKRFGVVATEIRTLADNVMESTTEIEGKIKEIKSAVNNLVVASEKSSRTVEESVSESARVSKQIETVVHSVEANTDSARQISTATKQQKTASEQVVIAVKEISVGANQVSIAMKQIDSVSKEMAKRAEELKNMVSVFKV